MVREIMRDEAFLSQKAEPASLEDLPAAQDLLNFPPSNHAGRIFSLSAAPYMARTPARRYRRRYSLCGRVYEIRLWTAAAIALSICCFPSLD